MSTPSLYPFPYLQPSNYGIAQASYSLFSCSTCLGDPYTFQIAITLCQFVISVTSYESSIHRLASGAHDSPSSGLTNELLLDFFQAVFTQYL